MEEEVQRAAEFIRGHFPDMPRIAVVLGSGLGEFGDTLEGRKTLDTHDIPGYPQSTVEGHKGRIVAGSISQTPLLALQGRIHFYETESIGPVLFPIAVLRQLGIRTIILTNAAGGISPGLEPGDLMVISDQLNLTGMPPHREVTHAGKRDIYSRPLLGLLLSVAAQEGIPLRRGTYVGVKGPSYETAAEIAMVRRLGGDAVGMSTVLEARAASGFGMEVVGISCITNKSTGLGTDRLNHREVTEVADRVKGTFIRLLTEFVRALGEKTKTRPSL